MSRKQTSNMSKRWREQGKIQKSPLIKQCVRIWVKEIKLKPFLTIPSKQIKPSEKISAHIKQSPELCHCGKPGRSNSLYICIWNTERTPKLKMAKLKGEKTQTHTLLKHSVWGGQFGKFHSLHIYLSFLHLMPFSDDLPFVTGFCHFWVSFRDRLLAPNASLSVQLYQLYSLSMWPYKSSVFGGCFLVLMYFFSSPTQGIKQSNAFTNMSEYEHFFSLSLFWHTEDDELSETCLRKELHAWVWNLLI